MVDHLVQNVLPFFTKIEGETRHVKRYKKYPDQVVLYGILTQIRDMGMTLISLSFQNVKEDGLLWAYGWRLITNKIGYASVMVVIRPPPRLIEKLSTGLNGKLTLVSAPAGFGKTTLVSEWVAACEMPTTWLSLDEEDSDPVRFLRYFITGLQTIHAYLGEEILQVFESAQPLSLKTAVANSQTMLERLEQANLFM